MRSAKSFLLAILVVTGFARSSRADEQLQLSQKTDDDRPHRSGFTLALSMGLGGNYISTDGGANRNYLGISTLNFELGGFVTPNLAILVKAAGSNFSVFEDRLSAAQTSVTGVAVQYWLGDHLNLEAGLGAAYTTFQPEPTGPKFEEFGVAPMFAVDYVPYAGKHNGIGFFVNVQPTISTGGTLSTTYQAGIGWQWY